MVLGMKRKMLWVSLTAALCTSATPGLVTANDGTNGPPPKDTKPDAPQALTERERWLLDRIEQLEKGVAQLESQSNSPAASVSTAFLNPYVWYSSCSSHGRAESSQSCARNV
jgi:hypothetical protein